MEIEGNKTLQTVNYVVLLVMLSVIAIGLGALTYLTTISAPQNTDQNIQKLLVRMGWVSLFLLSLTLILFFWVAIRFFRSGFKFQLRRKDTPYVDAWELAGKRFELDESQQEDSEEK